MIELDCSIFEPDDECLYPQVKATTGYRYGCRCSTGRSCGNCVRGIVCRRCNTLLGFVEATGNLELEQALRYLKSKGKRQTPTTPLTPPLPVTPLIIGALRNGATL